jgi:hypothetical protein
VKLATIRTASGTAAVRIEGEQAVEVGAYASPDDREEGINGSGPSASGSIAGRPQQIAGWLTGRAGAAGLTATGAVPDLPRWL